MDLWRKYRDSDLMYKLNSKHNNKFDEIFTALDSLCSDEELRDEFDLDEKELYKEVERLYSK